MADIPTPRSYVQVLGDEVDTLLSKIGLTSIKVGGPIAALLETTATSQTRTSSDIFAMLASRDIDNADGEALTNAGADEGISIRPATFASTNIVVGDSTFTKISSRIYQGSPAPASGSATISVADASLFPASGSIYVGRGTVNLEGPLAYTSKALDGTSSFWIITLTSPTTKFHNLSETVIVAQGGDRSIAAGTVVGTTGTINTIKFTTTTTTTLLDGEDTLTGVSVVCQVTGISGNVPTNSLQVFDSAPFAGAVANNLLNVTNALPAESKEEFRERIKDVRRSKTLGTDLAITTAVFRATAPDQNTTVTSSSLVGDILYVDDGTGYEETDTGVAIESVIDEAAGGETDVQIMGGLPVAKAFTAAGNVGPYVLSSTSALAVRVGGVTSTTTFLTTSFRDITAATAYEVVAAINGDSTITFSAHTIQSGQAFVVFARGVDTNEDVQVVAPTTGTDANTVFNFPAARFDTLRLYKNDQILFKDGASAFIETTVQSTWNSTLIAPGLTLSLPVAVDSTAFVTYTFTNADFVNANTGYATMSTSNSLAAWATVINAKIAGITALVESNVLRLVSNAGPTTRAKVSINLSNTAIQSMFAGTGIISNVGRSNDYVFNRNTGELSLSVPLAKNDRLSAGTIYTRAYIESGDFTSHTVAAGGANLWWVADGAAAVIPTSVTSTTVLTFTDVTIAGGGGAGGGGGGGNSHHLKFASAANTFANVLRKDWVILWDPVFASPSILGTYHVADIAGDFSWVELEYHGGALPGGLPGTYTPAANGFVVVRTPATIQQLVIAAGVVSPATLATNVTSQLTGVTSSTVRTTRLRVTTNTFGSEGDIALVAMDVEGAKLLLNVQTVVNETAHLGTAESGHTDRGTPFFNYTTNIGPGSAGVLTTTDSSTGGFVAGAGMVWKNPISTTGIRSSLLLGYKPIATSIVAGATVNVNDTNFPGVGDRAYPCSLFATAPDDTLSLVLDGDPVSKSFSTGLAYKVAFTAGTIGYHGATVVATAADGSNLNVPFPNTFDFSEFTLYPRARAEANPPVANAEAVNAVLWRFNRYGLDGGKARISYTNPLAPSAGYTVTTNQDDIFDIFVGLPGGAARSITNGQRYAVKSSVSGSIRQVVYYAGVRASLTSAGGAGADVTATITTGGGSPNPYLTDHFFENGDKVYVAGSASFPAGMGTVNVAGDSSFTVFVFKYDTATPPNVGGGGEMNSVLNSTGSTPTLPLALTGAVIGDIVTINSSTRMDPTVQGTYRIADLDSAAGLAGSGNALWFMVHRVSGSAIALTYKEIVAAANITIYPIDTTKTATTGSPNIVTLVNALPTNLWVTGALPVYREIDDSNSIIAGSPITVSTLDAYLEDNTQPQNGFTFIDSGFYVVSSALSGNNYQLTINGSDPAEAANWSSDEDWTHELAYLVPKTAKALVRYLNLSSVTGLASNAEIKACARLNKLQFASLVPGSGGSVKVSGGSANAVTATVLGSAIQNPTGSGCLVQVKTQDAVGLMSGQWAAVQGIIKTPKTNNWDTTTEFTITGNNLVTLSAGTGQFSKYAGSMTAGVLASDWQIEQHGAFAAYVYADAGPPTDFHLVKEGDWVMITSATGSAANLCPSNCKRIVRIVYDTPNTKWAFWVENTAVEESVVLDKVEFWDANSVLPGDFFSVNTNDLGAANLNQQGWVVATLGTPSGGLVTSFTVTGTPLANADDIVPGGDIRTIQIIPANPSRLIKRILYVTPTADTRFTYVTFDTSAQLGEISNTAGSYIAPLDKFGFGTGVAVGLDGYRYATGLIGECTRILYGDMSDTDTYPGVIAKGAEINISGPLVHRVQVSLSIRVRPGVAKDVLARVQAAVAGVINSAGVGESISIADIVAAAKKVRGVAGVTILSPTYGPGSDQISIQAYEKPMVINLDTDVLVSLTGV